MLDDPAKRDAAMVKATELQQNTRNEEPGCQFYCFSPDPAVPGQVSVYELWDDEESLALHFQHPYYKTMGGHFGETGLAWAKSQKFRVTAMDPVYDDTKTATAEFQSASEQHPDQMIIIGGTIDLSDPSERAGFLERSVEHQLATRNDEPGCVEYVFSADPCLPERIQVSETWENQETLAAHFHHENYRNMGALFGELSGRDSNNNKFRIDVAEEVYDETRTPRADFFTV